jgi:hypothetical protein
MNFDDELRITMEIVKRMEAFTAETSKLYGNWKTFECMCVTIGQWIANQREDKQKECFEKAQLYIRAALEARKLAEMFTKPPEGPTRKPEARP